MTQWIRGEWKYMVAPGCCTNRYITQYTLNFALHFFLAHTLTFYLFSFLFPLSFRKREGEREKPLVHYVLSPRQTQIYALTYETKHPYDKLGFNDVSS